MRTRVIARLVQHVAAVSFCLLPARGAEPARGTVLCPVVTGGPEKLPFSGHPGWLDVYPAGDAEASSARIGEGGTYDATAGEGARAAAVASFDHIEEDRR